MAQEQTNENNYVHYFKTAVALACIRSKPPGVSSREYAENLCAQYRAAGDRWKQKYEEAERTILRLKQTQELQSSLNFSDLADLLPFVSFNNGPSQIQSEEPMQVDVEGSANQIKQNTDFLKSFLMLKQLKKELPHKITVDNTVHSTLLDSLYLVTKSIYQEEGVSIPIIRSSFQVISHLSTVMNKNFPLVEIQKLVQTVLERALESKTFERKQRKELILSLREFLTPQTRHIVLDSSLAAVESFSAHLRTVNESETPLNTQKYENIYYVFDLLQIVLENYRSQSDNNSQKINFSHDADIQTLEILNQVAERLDKCVLYISDIFPLFVCKIWLIKDNFLLNLR